MLFSFCRVSVSRAIKPFAEPGRPPDWFSQKVSSQVYVLLEHFLRCKVGSLPGPACPPNPSTASVFFKLSCSFGLPLLLCGKESCQCRGYGLDPWSGKPLEKEMATLSSILAWEIPWTEEPGQATVHQVAKEFDTTW